jgi:predicted ATP-grasp superfamily ATP-dependent carboligase
MNDLTTNAGVGGLAGLVGTIAGLFSNKTKIKCLEKKVEKLRDTMRSKESCEGIIQNFNVRLDALEKMNSEIRSDIKELLKR